MFKRFKRFVLEMMGALSRRMKRSRDKNGGLLEALLVVGLSIGLILAGILFFVGLVALGVALMWGLPALIIHYLYSNLIANQLGLPHIPFLTVFACVGVTSMVLGIVKSVLWRAS